MIDTSVMIAGLIHNHEFHSFARPHVADAAHRERVVGMQEVFRGYTVGDAWGATSS